MMMMNQKLSAIHKKLQQKHLDAVLFSDSFSVRFFTGFSSSHGFLLITKDSADFFTDARYLEAAKDFFKNSPSGEGELEGVEKIEVHDIPKKWSAIFSAEKIKKMGVEKGKITASVFEKWEKEFYDFPPEKGGVRGVKMELCDFSPETSLLRAQKSEEEIANAQGAAAIADAALKQVLSLLQPGITEKEFAWELEKAGRELGAEKVSFEAIVAFGENSAVPHHHPTDRELKKNEAVLIDWGFLFGGMCSDCTRCFFVGDTLDTQWEETYYKVWKGQKKGIEYIAAGKKIAEVQIACEEEMGEKIPHSFGHGVGYEVHEYPTLSPKAKDATFLENMIVTAEPGIYKTGKFGIRIEDMGAVTKEGYEILTQFPKENYFLKI